MSDAKFVERYTPKERGNHWIVALCFILAALSGLSLFHPSLFFFSGLFGGGPWARILHPFIGVVMFLFFCISFSFAGCISRASGVIRSIRLIRLIRLNLW